MFGRTLFPPIGELPYFLTLAPHAFFWFSLEPQLIEAVAAEVHWADLPVLNVVGVWDNIVQGSGKAVLESVFPNYIKERRWFGGKSRTILAVHIIESIAMPQNDLEGAYLVLLSVRFTEGDPQTYALPITFATGERARSVRENIPQTIIAQLKLNGHDAPGVLYDALWDRDFSLLPLQAIAQHREFPGVEGKAIATTTSAFQPILGDKTADDLDPSLARGEQSNTSVIYSDRFILKLFRRLEAGANPDLEIGRYLTDQRHFACIPPVAGAIEYRKGNAEPITLAILQGFVPNEGDAWKYTLDTLSGYFERILSEYAEREAVKPPDKPLLELIDEELPDLPRDMIDHYLEAARLLGQRTAEMHLALSAEVTGVSFAPESFSTMYQRSVYQTMRSQLGRVFQSLHKSLPKLPEAARPDAEKVHKLEPRILDCFQQMLALKISTARIRCHGDYHLGQVLFTGNDFMIIDFEGEPAKLLSERRRKRSPLTDVAGMLRSFHYAAYTAFFNEIESGIVLPEHIASTERWARFWYTWVSATFLKSYLKTSASASFIPPTRDQIQAMLTAYLMDKAVYELGYELNSRPSWARIPIWGIFNLLGEYAE
ncbi:MAG: putative maltokinase [Chloroflexales bacterium]|nr:putative maltokinase [Chloroflexales bacterium]